MLLEDKKNTATFLYIVKKHGIHLQTETQS